jgi:hypothetical protein
MKLSMVTLAMSASLALAAPLNQRSDEITKRGAMETRQVEEKRALTAEDAASITRRALTDNEVRTVAKRALTDEEIDTITKRALAALEDEEITKRGAAGY